MQQTKKIERDKMIFVIENEPKQFQLVLLSIMQLSERRSGAVMFTGEIYNAYQENCIVSKNEILTQRRVSDMIAEFDMLGLISAQVISKGRQGRTREIKLMLPINIKDKVKEVLHTSLTL